MPDLRGITQDAEPSPIAAKQARLSIRVTSRATVRRPPLADPVPGTLHFRPELQRAHAGTIDQ